MANRYGPGDVRFFDRTAAVHDLLTPAADAGPLRAGLAFADRSVERVLDVAGGTGRATRALADDGLESVVVDASRGMLARARADGHPVVRADAGALPFSDDCVDAVVVLDALHHLPDPERGLREAARVVAPGGVVVVQEFGPGTLRGRGLALAERAVGFDSEFWAPAELCALFERVGLDARIVSEGFDYVVVGRVPPESGA